MSISGLRDEELTDVALRYVQGPKGIRRDTLGPIDITSRYAEVRQLIASVFITEPESVLQLIFLAANKLSQRVSKLLDWISDIIVAIDEIGRQPTAITSTSALKDAFTSLLVADSTLSEQGKLSSKLVEKYVVSVDQFIHSSLLPNIKGDNELVRTRPEAQIAIKTVLDDVNSAHSMILTDAEQITTALSEYTKLDLVSLIIAKSIKAIRSDLQEMMARLDTSSDEEKLAAARNMFLQLTVSKSVLQHYSKLPDPRMSKLSESSSRIGNLTGIGVDPAAVRTTRSAPWGQDGVELTIVLSINGEAPMSFSFARRVTANDLAADLNRLPNVKATVTVDRILGGDKNGSNISEHEFLLPLNTIPDEGLGTFYRGKQLLILSGQSAGYHRISSITRGVTEDIVFVEEPLYVTDPPVLQTGQSWAIVEEGIVISPKTTAGNNLSKVEIGDGSANAELGLVSGVYYGTATGIAAIENGRSVDFAAARIIPGDILRINGEQHAIKEIRDLVLVVDLPVSTSHVDFRFEIVSAAATRYPELQNSLAAWLADVKSSPLYDIASYLAGALNPLLLNKNPSAAQRGNAKSKLQALLDSYSRLHTALQGYDVGISSSLDAALKLLLERGMTRAYDALVSGRFSLFFGMDADDAAPSSYLLKTMRLVAQDDIPISKRKDLDAEPYELAEEADADQDYSDADLDEDDERYRDALSLGVE